MGAHRKFTGPFWTQKNALKNAGFGTLFGSAPWAASYFAGTAGERNGK